MVLFNENRGGSKLVSIDPFWQAVLSASVLFHSQNGSFDTSSAHLCFHKTVPFQYFSVGNPDWDLKSQNVTHPKIIKKFRARKWCFVILEDWSLLLEPWSLLRSIVVLPRKKLEFYFSNLKHWKQEYTNSWAMWLDNSMTGPGVGTVIYVLCW